MKKKTSKKQNKWSCQIDYEELKRKERNDALKNFFLRIIFGLIILIAILLYFGTKINE